MITPEPKPVDPAKEVCVPVSALEANGAAPEAGGEIEFTGKARVTRLEGESAYLEVTHVNNEAVMEPKAEAVSDDDMLRMAAEADQEAQG